MLKHLLIIFFKDLKINSRDFISIYILLIPFLFAVGILAFIPSINDSTITVAFLQDGKPDMRQYFENFAKTEVFKDKESIIKRVEKRDNAVAVLPDLKTGKYYILYQGNEPQSILDYAKIIKSYYETGASIENTDTVFVDFGKKESPLKKILVNIAILFTSLLGGMLIAINIVEEKIDHTLSAINITPVSKNSFIFGKSMIGLLLPIIGTFALIIITGFVDVNFIQILLVVLISTFLSLIIGFIQGLKNNDIMSAAGSIKLLFLPMFASIAAIEFLSAKWQFFFWWSPFYWAYKAIDAILLKNSSWNQILRYSGIVLLISILVYIVFAPQIRKGLESRA